MSANFTTPASRAKPAITLISGCTLRCLSTLGVLVGAEADGPTAAIRLAILLGGWAEAFLQLDQGRLTPGGGGNLLLDLLDGVATQALDLWV